MLTAFGLMTVGYTLLGLCPHEAVVVPAFLTIAVGSAFVKPLVTGTVAKTVPEAHRARAYALFFWVVNIGSFSGKTFVPFIRLGPGFGTSTSSQRQCV
jgi:dipeptide/tripeptide permease